MSTSRVFFAKSLVCSERHDRHAAEVAASEFDDVAVFDRKHPATDPQPTGLASSFQKISSAIIAGEFNTLRLTTLFPSSKKPRHA